MKPILSAFIVFLAMLVVACAPLQASQPASDVLPTPLPAATKPAVEATSQGSSTVVGVAPATVTSLSTVPAAADNGTGAPSGSALPTEVTFSDNGRTLVMQVGESFLLKLDMDGYDWTVEVDNQNVIQRELNVMVLRGTQGIYIVQNPGTAIMIATGDPLCRQSKPPCMRPTILFSITVLVK